MIHHQSNFKEDQDFKHIRVLTYILGLYSQSMPQVYRVYSSSVFIGLVSQYTFFIHLESISSFRKFSTVNHKRQNLNSAQDNTHISTSTLFTKFTVIHKENTTSNFSYASSTFPEKVLVKMVRRLLAFLNCKDITIFSSRYLHASSGSGLKYFSVFGPLRFPVFLLSIVLLIQ